MGINNLAFNLVIKAHYFLKIKECIVDRWFDWQPCRSPFYLLKVKFFSFFKFGGKKAVKLMYCQINAPSELTRVYIWK